MRFRRAKQVRLTDPPHGCARPSQAQEMTLVHCPCGRSWLAMEVTGGFVLRWRDVTATAMGRVWANERAAISKGTQQ